MKIIPHNLKILLTFIVFSLLVFPQTDLSEEKSNLNFGLSIGGLNSVNNFDRLGNNPACCGVYEGGSGISLMIPLNYRFDISYILKPIIGANLLYDNQEFKNSQSYITRVGLQEIQNSTVSTRTSIGFGAGFSFTYNAFTITSMGNMNYNMLNIYSQSEVLNSIEGDLSENTQLRKFDSQNADLASDFIGFLTFKISYDIELNSRKNYLSPNILIRQSFFSEHSQDNWLITGIYFGISFKRKSFYEFSTPLEPK